MKAIKRYYKTYWPFASSTIKAEFLAYRINLLIWILYEVLSFTIIFFLWTAIYDNSSTDTIRGLTFAFMIYYYLVSKLVYYFTDIEFGGKIGEDVRKGTIAMRLIKPINYRTQLLFVGIGRALGYLLFFGLLPIVGIIVLNNSYDMGLVFSIEQIATFFVSCVLALYLTFCIKLITGALRIYVVNGFGVFNLEKAILSFFSGSLIPLFLFPIWAQDIFKFLPFQHTVYTPTLLLTGQHDGLLNTLMWQAIWIVIMYFISLVIWKKALRKAASFGG